MISATDDWTVPVLSPALGEGEAHVWRVKLEVTPADLNALSAVLSPEERERAARFRGPALQRRFIAARGWLRCLLGRYLDADPRQLAFSFNAFGKPSLAQPGANLRFNISHSHELALLAFARQRELGVDIERVRPDLSIDEIADRFFAPVEAARLRALPGPQQIEAFFRCWTRKEAYIKARGDGLFRALDQFSVAFAPGQRPAILHSEDDPQAAARWSVWNLAAAPDYSGALVVEGMGIKLALWQPAD